MSRRTGGADSMSGDLKPTMSEILFLFGRRPSDVRWLELVDHREDVALVSYLAERARRRPWRSLRASLMVGMARLAHDTHEMTRRSFLAMVGWEHSARHR